MMRLRDLVLSSANQPTGGPKIQSVRVTLLGRISHLHSEGEEGNDLRTIPAVPAFSSNTHQDMTCATPWTVDEGSNVHRDKRLT